ncbi:hypothetical protein Naga_100180g1 [Nannochloropsis gaditana]|uniref:Uncharacterized protein n=1 Tax=Nannochloropsis gaditana TaxID=72520 RepID=W7TEY4_9STRA|nr:hypothetical protein Naga_100180g1 [Nannochloropsis gaditana]
MSLNFPVLLIVPSLPLPTLPPSRRIFIQTSAVSFSGLGGFLKRVVSTLLAPLAGSSPPSFTSTFEKEFGTAHVPFLEAPPPTRLGAGSCLLPLPHRVPAVFLPPGRKASQSFLQDLDCALPPSLRGCRLCLVGDPPPPPHPTGPPGRN